MPKKPSPTLSIVTETEPTSPESPRTLGQHGLSLWTRIQREYAVSDAGGVELLCLACEAIDRVRMLREEIARDGAVVRLRNGGVKEHPALRAEIACMSFITRTLARLGLDVEPVKPVGR